MICPKCDQPFLTQCECGYRPKQPKTWLIQPCATPGCSVQIRCLPGSQETMPRCKWHTADTAYNTRAIHSTPSSGPLMSRDEFGQDLFDAIKTQSALRQAEHTHAIYQRKGLTRHATETATTVNALQRQLTTILERNTIAPEDLTRLLNIL